MGEPANGEVEPSGPRTTTSSNDPFLEQFFARLPAKLHTSFTDRQLAALKSVFGEATHTGHGVDLRLSVPLPPTGKRAYLVLLGGRHRRKRERPKRRLRGRIVAVVVGGLFVAQIILALTANVLMLV